MQSMGKKYLFTRSKHHLSAIISRPHCKMQPNRTVAILFERELNVLLQRICGKIANNP